MLLFRSFNEIENDAKELTDLFINREHFLAHTSKSKLNETLHEHINEVKNYFLHLVKLNDLELIIDRIITELASDNQETGNFVKELFFYAIVFHDFGKTNPNFQFERMQNLAFKKDESIKIGYEHSFLSAYYFLNFCTERISKKKLTNNERTNAYAFSFLFSIPILKHHSGFLEKDYEFTVEKIDSIHSITEILNLNISKDQIRKLLDYENTQNEKSLWSVLSKLNTENKNYYFAVFALLKLNYSLLTASDYYATANYMSDLKFETAEDFGILTQETKNKLINNFDNNTEFPWNSELINQTDKFLNKNLTELLEKKNENLNFIRQKMGAEILTNISTFKNERVFYIEAPTGGGKTNMSMIAVRKLIELHKEINKVFYVFPFTTLITQTAKAIKGAFKLNDWDIAQIHSKAGFQEKEYSTENETDAKYGKEKRNQIDNLFVNYPFSLMTHIKFFEILKSNKKDSNYLLHRLANSVVIIDELQSYNPDHWDKIKYFVAQYAELFNIRFIIMSATLPKIDEIDLSGYKPKRFISLIENSKEYLQNPNFAGRVNIRTDLLDKPREPQELADILFEKSKLYANNRNDKYKGSVHTIIEFIFKKSAGEFYEVVLEKENFFDEIFVLSGTILEPRRKYIIDFLKDEANRKKKVLLITTQVVEAGVDIDMDLGFKNQSLIDSDEQLAGRINRNVNKQNCELWLFKKDSAKTIYGNDIRYQEALKFSSDKISEILTNKSFEDLYKNVFAKIIKTNESAYIKGFNEYKDNFKRIDFRAIQQQFKLIESENISIFVPVEISRFGYKNNENFTENEYKFIADNDCLSAENKICGEKIWNLYESFIENKEKKFSHEKLILNGIMSKFVFSVFANKIKDLFQFIENPPTGDDRNSQQFFKLSLDAINEIYTETGGLNEIRLKEITGKSYEFI